MRIKLETKVQGNYIEILKAFDKELFIALAPKAVKIQLVEFTGSKKGDRVHIRFLKPIKSEWISDITEDGIDQEQAYFVDKGRVLPFPLKFWEHKHIIRKIDDEHSLIVDDISYKGYNGIISLLMYPFVYAGFLPRKAIYKRYFAERFTTHESFPSSD